MLLRELASEINPIPEAVDSSTYRQKKATSKGSKTGRVEMFVPINLDGQLVQISSVGSSKHGQSSVHALRNHSSVDFSMYANAFGKKLDG